MLPPPTTLQLMEIG